jgi:flagellar FliJ protein
MAQFEFRLKTLLSLRCAERDERRAELAGGQALKRQLVERRRRVEDQLEGHLETARAGAAPGVIELKNLRSAHQYEAALRALLASLAESETAADAEVGRCQDALAAAEGEVGVLEKLRERQHDAFRYEQARLDARRADELAARAHRGCHDAMLALGKPARDG